MKPARPVLFLLTAMLASPLAGCLSGSTSSTINKTLYRANLDACNEVCLRHEAVKTREGWGPEECCERITVVVRPLPKPEAEFRLDRKPAAVWPSWSQFRFGDIEARIDELGERIWFVDRATGKVIGAIDRDSGKATGPQDEAPAWATPNRGRLLDPSAG